MDHTIDQVRDDLRTALNARGGRLTLIENRGITQAMLTVLKAEKPEDYAVITQELKDFLFTLAMEISEKDATAVNRVQRTEAFDVAKLAKPATSSTSETSEISNNSNSAPAVVKNENPVANIQNNSGVPKDDSSKNIKPSDSVVTKEQIKESNSVSKSSVEYAYDDFMSYARNTDKWFAGLRNSKQDIESIRKVLTERFDKFDKISKAYIASGGNSEDVNRMRLNIAYYYTDDLSGVSSSNQMDIIASQNLCLEILRNTVSKLPTTEEQLFKAFEVIKVKNPKLGDLISNQITEQQSRGEKFNLSIILSNPLVKGGWEKAYDEIYGVSLKQIDNEIDMLKGEKYSTLSDIQKKAVNHLRDIRGKGGMFDFTVQNREQMWQVLKYGSAIGAGILAAIPTAGGSLGVVALGVTASAVVTTGGTLLAQGYRGSASEVAQEAGINVISFGGGAVLFKLASGAKAIALAEKTSKVLVYGAEGIGNIGIGVGTDTLRARLHGEDLDIWSSIQQNLIWAALPFALRMKGKKVPPEVMDDAEQVNNLTQAASVQSALGKSPKSLFAKMNASLARLKFWGEKNNTTSPVTLESEWTPVVRNRRVGGNIDEETIRINQKLSVKDRITAVNQRLEITMNARQRLVLMNAHNNPSNAEKIKILGAKKIGADGKPQIGIDGKPETIFTRQERAILLDEGYAGTAPHGHAAPGAAAAEVVPRTAAESIAAMSTNMQNLNSMLETINARGLKKIIDIASKELPLGEGRLKPFGVDILRQPGNDILNLVRLPAINSRRLFHAFVKKEKGSDGVEFYTWNEKSKFSGIIKAIGTPGENVFTEGKINMAISMVYMAGIALNIANKVWENSTRSTDPNSPAWAIFKGLMDYVWTLNTQGVAGGLGVMNWTFGLKSMDPGHFRQFITQWTEANRD